ncbi:hypothetical protein ACIPRI_24730 [Variovorax sp. LARHSF232]
MQALNKTNLLRFITFGIDKGLVKAATGNSWKAAVSKILETYGPEDDLSAIDVVTEVRMFNNRNPSALSPDSLKTYQGRLVIALNEFKKYQDDPTKYKGISARVPSAKSQDKPKKKQADTYEPAMPMNSNSSLEVIDVQAKPAQSASAVSAGSLVMPFPLRPSFLAQIVIPRDMNREEAARLCSFITSLGQDL